MRTEWIVSFCVAGTLAATATAALVIPTSYMATPGEGIAQGGSYNYFDDTGTQLTDGIFGINDWTANLGNGHAYEWVGWQNAEPTMTFNFASSVTLDQVIIGFNRASNAGIYLPATVTIGSSVFTLTRSELTDGTRGDLIFNGSWTGSTLTVQLADGGPGWIFVDEIRFQAIPEPGAVTAVAALGLLGFVVYRRSQRH